MQPKIDSSEEKMGSRFSERGASLVEYALLMALIAVVCIGAVTAFGSATGNSVDRSRKCMFIEPGDPIPANCSTP